LEDAKDQPEEFGVDEFVRRAAEREEVDADTALRHADAVFRALARVAPAYEIDDLVEELPPDYERLVGDVAGRIRESTQPEIRTFGELVDRVKQRAGLDFIEAERAAEVVLETLAERLAAEEVEDLQAALPKQFRGTLERGKAHGRRRPAKMSLDEFVEQVARKERVSFEEALEHTRAVIVTLAEALPYAELRDVLHELPRGYRETLL
jgi:uncharacterized protein (DUF2267 family)